MFDFDLFLCMRCDGVVRNRERLFEWKRTRVFTKELKRERQRRGWEGFLLPRDETMNTISTLRDSIALRSSKRIKASKNSTVRYPSSNVIYLKIGPLWNTGSWSKCAPRAARTASLHRFFFFQFRDTSPLHLFVCFILHAYRFQTGSIFAVFAINRMRASSSIFLSIFFFLFSLSRYSDADVLGVECRIALRQIAATLASARGTLIRIIPYESLSDGVLAIVALSARGS